MAFAAASALIVLRRPADFERPQFFADDGPFFETAYNHGWRVFLPHNGYFNAIPSLAASIAVLLPLAWAPLFFALLALLLHALPVGFLLSSRCSCLGRARWPLAIAYLALPGTDWLNANLCHAQWHLAVLGFLIVAVAQDGSKLFDRIALAGLGLSSIFGLLLLPVSRRYRWLLGLTAAVQVGTVLVSTREGTPKLHAGLVPLATIVANHIVLGSLMGRSPWEPTPTVARFAIATAGVAVVVYAVWRGPSVLRRFWTFAAVVLAASLAGSQFAWPQLAAEGWAQRYWFIPALAFVTTLGWMACRGNQLAKVVGCGLLFLMLAALPVTWRYPARVDYDFPAQVARFENAPAGSPVQFRFNPVGWTMCLSKRQ